MGQLKIRKKEEPKVETKYYCPICKGWFTFYGNSECNAHRRECLDKLYTEKAKEATQ